MATGPGKYDELATQVREQAEAQGVILMVLDGKDGSGFSVQADMATTMALPELLENVAKQIRNDLIEMQKAE